MNIRILASMAVLALTGCASHQIEIVNAYKAGVAAGVQLSRDWCTPLAGWQVSRARGEWKMYMTYISLADHKIHRVSVCHALGIHCAVYSTREACDKLSYPPHGPGMSAATMREWVRGVGGDPNDGIMATCSTEHPNAN